MADQYGKVRDLELWIDGLLIERVTDFGGDNTVTEISDPVMGFRANIDDKSTTGGTLSVTNLGYLAKNRMQRALLGRNPFTAVPGLEKKNDDAIVTLAWANHKTADESGYDDATYFGVWTPGVVPGETEGGKDERPKPQFSGNTHQHVQYEGMFIWFEKISAVAMGDGRFSGSLGTAPTQIVGPGDYILDLVLFSGTADPLNVHYVAGGRGMCDNAGDIIVPVDNMNQVPEAWNGACTHLGAVRITAGAASGVKSKGTLTTPVVENYWT